MANNCKEEIIDLISEITEIDKDEVADFLIDAGFSIDEMVSDLEIGIANGHSKEFQFDLIRKFFKHE